MTIAIFGTFKANVGVNATTWYFVDADHAGLVGWGDEEFCSRTTVLQATDGFSRDKCPPTEGCAVLLTDFLIEWYWPPVSTVFCYFEVVQPAAKFRRVNGIYLLM